MARSDAATVEGYLAQLPAERRELVEAVRSTILDHLPDGFEETVTSGMLAHVVPRERFSDTYNRRPLAVLTVANQQRHVAVHLMGVYAWTATGKKLDMGRSCVRFRRLDDVALDVLGEAVARVRPEDLIASHEAVHGHR